MRGVAAWVRGTRPIAAEETGCDRRHRPRYRPSPPQASPPHAPSASVAPAVHKQNSNASFLQDRYSSDDDPIELAQAAAPSAPSSSTPTPLHPAKSTKDKGKRRVKTEPDTGGQGRAKKAKAASKDGQTSAKNEAPTKSTKHSGRQPGSSNYTEADLRALFKRAATHARRR